MFATWPAQIAASTFN